MLNMTVKAGECIQIGEDVRIVFPDSNISNHIKIGIDAPKEKKVERVMEPKKKKQVVIVRTREN